MEENKKPDDGSLAFLNIPRDESNRSFNCDETTQSKLVNKLSLLGSVGRNTATAETY